MITFSVVYILLKLVVSSHSQTTIKNNLYTILCLQFQQGGVDVHKEEKHAKVY